MAQKVRILCDEVDENNNYILRAGEIGILREPDTYTEAEKQELAQFPGQDMRLVYVPRLNTSELFAMDELALVTESVAMPSSAEKSAAAPVLPALADKADKEQYQVGDVVELLQDSANLFFAEKPKMDIMIAKAKGEWDDDDDEDYDVGEEPRRALKGYHAVVYWKDTFVDRLCVRILENGCYGFLEKAIVRYVSAIKFSAKKEPPAVGSKVRVRWGKTDRFDRVIYPPGSVGVVIDPDDGGSFGSDTLESCEVLVAEGEETTLFLAEFGEISKYDLEPISATEYRRLAKPRLQVGDTVRVKDEPEAYLLAVQEGWAASYNGPRKGDSGVVVDVMTEYPYAFVTEINRFKERYISDEDAYEDLEVSGYLLEKTGHTENAGPGVAAAANPGCLMMVALLLLVMALGVLL